ncbi:MAG: DUF4912 domain-containing protein [Candidatus Brocadia sp.]|jgi:hypothetical protein
MDKGVIKEIFLLILEIIKALCGTLWKKIKDLLALIWDRFFGMSDISSEGRAEEEEWGATGEDTWPTILEAPSVKPEEPHREIERKDIVYVPPVPELPDNYGDNRIVLMVVDPEWLFTYWEIQKSAMDSVLNMPGTMIHGARLALRVYDVTDIIFDGNNAHKCYDIEVTGGARNWYIRVGEPNRSFCVDIGFLASDGTFHTLCRSNVARTPRAGVSEVVDEKWMGIEEIYEKVYAPTGFGISESVFERAHKGWQEILKEGASSPNPDKSEV